MLAFSSRFNLLPSLPVTSLCDEPVCSEARRCVRVEIDRETLDDSFYLRARGTEGTEEITRRLEGIESGCKQFKCLHEARRRKSETDS